MGPRTNLVTKRQHVVFSHLTLPSKLVLHNRVSCFCAFNGYCLCNINVFVCCYLQRQLNCPVLGLAHPSVRQLSDKLRLRLDSGLCHKVERAVGHLLRHAVHPPHTLHLIGHRIIGRKEEILALVVESDTAKLHVLARIDLIVSHNVIVFKPYHRPLTKPYPLPLPSREGSGFFIKIKSL